MTKTHFDYNYDNSNDATLMAATSGVMKRLRARIARRPGRWRRRMHTKTHRGQSPENDLPAAA